MTRLNIGIEKYINKLLIWNIVFNKAVTFPYEDSLTIVLCRLSNAFHYKNAYVNVFFYVLHLLFQQSIYVNQTLACMEENVLQLQNIPLNVIVEIQVM